MEMLQRAVGQRTQAVPGYAIGIPTHPTTKMKFVLRE